MASFTFCSFIKRSFELQRFWIQDRVESINVRFLGSLLIIKTVVVTIVVFRSAIVICVTRFVTQILEIVVVAAVVAISTTIDVKTRFSFLLIILVVSSIVRRPFLIRIVIGSVSKFISIILIPVFSLVLLIITLLFVKLVGIAAA